MFTSTLATIPWGEGIKVMVTGLSGVFMALGLVYVGTRSITAGVTLHKKYTEKKKEQAQS